MKKITKNLLYLSMAFIIMSAILMFIYFFTSKNIEVPTKNGIVSVFIGHMTLDGKDHAPEKLWALGCFFLGLIAIFFFVFALLKECKGLQKEEKKIVNKKMLLMQIAIGLAILSSTILIFIVPNKTRENPIKIAWFYIDLLIMAIALICAITAIVKTVQIKDSLIQDQDNVADEF